MRFRDRFDRSKRQPSTKRQRIGFAFFWLLVLAYAYSVPSTPSFNTESHLYLTFSIVNYGSLNIDHYHRRLGDESYFHGHYYSDKAPGLSLLAVPVYAALKVAFPTHHAQQYTPKGKYFYSIPRDTVYLRYAITYILLIIPAALLGVFMWLFLSRFIPSVWALVLTAAYCLGTTAYPYSMWYFSHQVCAILLFGAFMLLATWARGSSGDRRSLMFTALAGLLAGYAVISEYPTALIAALLGGYLLLVARDRLRVLAAFVAGMVPAALLGVGYNVLAFGSPLATGYMHVNSYMYHHQVKGGALGTASPEAYGVQAPTWDSIWQITFGSYRGIFLLAPVLLLFIPGAVYLWRRRELRPELLLCVAAVLLYFLMDASRPQDVNGWSGGWSIASRHLVPMLPFMIFPIAFAVMHAPWRQIFLVAAAYSIAMMSAVAASTYSGGFPFTDQNPIVNSLLHSLGKGKVGLNWGYMTGELGPPTLLPLALIATLLVVRIVWVYRNVPERQVRDEQPSLAVHAS